MAGPTRTARMAAVMVLLAASICAAQAPASMAGMAAMPAAAAAAPKAAAPAVPAPKTPAIRTTPIRLTNTIAAGSALDALIKNNLTSFARVANASGLTPSLNSTLLRATLFVPTDAAYAKLASQFGTDLDGLMARRMVADRLAGQAVVVRKSLRAASLKDGAALTPVRGPEFAVSVKDGKVVRLLGAQNNATVVRPDITAGNVTIHVIDTVLLPDDVFPTLQSALDYKLVTGPAKDLINESPVMSKAAKDPNTNVTLFVASDKAYEAYAATPAGKAVLADPVKVQKVLEYHAVQGARILPNGIDGDVQVLPTKLKGQSLTVTKVKTAEPDGKVIGYIDVKSDAPGAKPARVGKLNLVAGSSMIHIVDNVLVPKGL